MDFFEQIPLKIFRKFKYDFHRDIQVIRNISEIKGEPIEILYPILTNSYCSLLKIRSIAQKGLSKDRAESNVNELFNWMIHDLKLFRGAEYQLAINIFGGNTVFRKMIGLDCKKMEVKKRLTGTVWDLVHSKFTTNSYRLFEVLKRNIYPFFLTSDANLFKLFQNCSLQVVKDGGANFVPSFILRSDFLCPHFDNSFIDRSNEKLLNAFVDRRNHEYFFDKVKVNNIINHLEFENGI